MLNQIIQKWEEHTDKEFDAQSMQRLEAIDKVLREFVGGGELEDNLEEIRGMLFKVLYNIPQNSPLIIPFPNLLPEYKGFVVQDYFLNSKRFFNEVISGFSKKNYPLVNLMFNDEDRSKALTKAKGHESELLAKLPLNGVNFRSGGIKSKESIKERKNSSRRFLKERKDSYQEGNNPLLFMRDLVRGRFVCRNLDTVVNVITAIEEMYGNEIIALFNSYPGGFSNFRKNNGEIKPYFAMHFTFPLDDLLPYELQVTTDNNATVSELNHPVIVKQSLILTEGETRYLYALSYGASFLDFFAYLYGKNALPEELNPDSKSERGARALKLKEALDL